MEALLLLFAPLIEIALLPVLAFCGAILGALIELFFWLMALIFGGAWMARREARKRQAAETAEAAAAPEPPRKPLVPRKLLHWSAGLMVGLGVLGLVALSLFFDPILRWGLARAEAKTGVAIRYETAQGNLLAGRLALTGVRMVRRSERGAAFDIAAERVAVDADLPSLLFEPAFDMAELTGVRGFVVPPEKDETERDGAEKGAKRARRVFTVQDIRIDDVALEVRPRGRSPWDFTITQARVAPFHSRLALFALLFRSNMQAEIAGQALSVETREVTAFGRETFWRFEGVEAAKLKLLLPRAPLTWLEGGRVNVQVDDRWSLDEDWIEMDWRLDFTGVAVKAPEGAGLQEKTLAAGFGKLVAARGGDASFHYKIDLDQKQIAVARAGDLSGFWDIVAEQLIGRAGSDEAKDAAEATDGKVRGVLGRVKNLLRKDEE